MNIYDKEKIEVDKKNLDEELYKQHKYSEEIKTY
jgi:hypothetical protein